MSAARAVERSSPLTALLSGADLVLTEAAVVERLRRECDLPAHAQLAYGDAVFEPRRREPLRRLYAEYIAVARRASLPLLLTSSTRRSNRETLTAAGCEPRAFAREWMAFLDEVRGHDLDVFLGALLGSRGDAYRPQEALSAAAAHAFHAPQCEAFAEAGAEFLLAATLPALSEAQGLATAMTETGLPFLVSFVIERSGRLLDGASLSSAIAAVDAVAPPTGYLVNCVHPENLLVGLAADANSGQASLSRLLGIQANASRLSPSQLEGSAELRSDGADSLARGMARLRGEHGLHIFGGCCGTDADYLEAIAAAVASVQV